MNAHAPAATPDVSVLMGVHNAAASLERTLDGILSQQGVELEFIVVDDGSTDASGGILDRRAATDPRLVVVHQANAGLTAALRRAAGLARAPLLARQDAGGDVSLPGRLAAQAALLRAHPEAVFATCGYRYVDIDGVFLCDEIPTAEGVSAGLSNLQVPGVRGIMHASSMFRADAFRAVGGYRAEFRVAQDIDLWLRLHEVGTCVVARQVLYDCRFELDGISSRRQAQQQAFARLAVDCAIARRAGRPEPPLQAQPAAEATDAVSSSRQVSDYHYFVASCLRRRDPARARRHYLHAWRARPMRLKALVRAGLTWLS